MGSKWTQYRLGDVTEWSSGGTPKKSNDSFWNGEIPWISASSMYGNRYRDSKNKITAEGLRNGTRLASKDSILLLVRGSMLHKAIPVGIAEIDVAFNQDVKALKVNEEVLDPWFLLFWFMSKEHDLLEMVENTGIGAGKFDTALLQNLKISIPPKEERRRIVTFAKALDDKIELNRRMNATLEGMAQALFKSWFVDFDPVIDNALAAGNPIPDELAPRARLRQGYAGQAEVRKKAPESNNPSLSAEASAKAGFPAAFQFTEELGWIPESWHAKQLGELCDQAIGGQWGEDKFQEGLVPAVCLRGCDMADISASGFGEKGPVRYIKPDALKKRTIQPNELLIAGSGAGPCGRPMWCSPSLSSERYGHQVIYSNFVKKFTFRNAKEAVFAEGVLMPMYQDGSIGDYINGTSVPNLDSNGLLSGLSLLLPSNDVLDAYYSFYTTIEQNRTRDENRTLVKLRDTLLPKLISGELRIPEAEQLTKESMA